MSISDLKNRIVLISLLVVFIPGAARSATLLSGLDFWYFEHLENQELRGGKSVQLNTKPLPVDPWDGKEEVRESAIMLQQVRLETSYSSQMPVVQQREGVWISRGGNLQFSAEMGFINDFMTLWIEPQVSFHENRTLEDYPEGRTQPISSGGIIRYPEAVDSYSTTSLHTAYLLVPFSNWYFFLGKDNLILGAGKHDTLHLGNSAEAFPMLRLGTISPWDTFLGYFSFLTYIGEMEKDRHIPRARFSGMRLNWSTSRRLEMGVSRSWLAGGDGQNNGVSHVFWDLYSEFFKPTSGNESYGDFRNQQLVLDFRLKIPEIKTVVYGEYGREDHEHGLKGIADRWYHTQAHILGIKQIDLLFPGFFWMIERAETVERYPFPDFVPWLKTPDDPSPAPTAWYNHHEYRNGWTYQGVCLGHHLGADSVDEYFALGWEYGSNSMMFYLDRETHGVLTYTEEEREEKTEIGIKGFWMIGGNWRLDYMIQHQEFENFGMVVDNSLRSDLIAIGFGYRY